MTDYPLLLNLTNRRVVVVGGGQVALRRISELVRCGALVQVIAPAVRNEITQLGVSVHLKSYVDGDLEGAWLVHACTDSPAVNRAVAAEAECRGVFCIRADAGAAGTAVTPAVARSGQLTVSVNAGGDPGRAKQLRNAIKAFLDTGELPVRPRRAGRAGTVALVGGGPGDPELITVRGRRLLAEADVVIVDRLAPRELLDSLEADVKIVDVGKAPHRHNLSQSEINDLLIDFARQGLRVVRLKGGDPFVFGRGGEEVEACAKEGIPVDVIPGISSAIAGPAAAGIPLTHRGVASDFAVISGHLDPSRPGSTIDWQALAEGPATLVLLMGLDRLDLIATELIKRGRPGSTPTAVIRNATLSDQQEIVGTLSTIDRLVRRAGIRPPAVVIIGEVVRLRDQLLRPPTHSSGKS